MEACRSNALRPHRRARTAERSAALPRTLRRFPARLCCRNSRTSAGSTPKCRTSPRWALEIW